MLVSSTIPNLIGGVSQQPAALRLKTTCDAAENTFPSIVSGLQKRPPTQKVANLGTALSGGACGYLIERNEGYRYITLVTDGDLKVLDLNTGANQTVTFPNGKDYLKATSPIDSFKFVTFGDYTFIVNRTKPVSSFFVQEGSSYTPDGTVTTLTALPTASVTYLSKIYKTTDTTKFYQCVYAPATSAKYSWDYQYTDSSEDAYYDGSRLPTPTAANQTFRLLTQEWRAGEVQGYVDVIKVYKSVQDSAAVAASYSWKERTLSEINPALETRRNPASEATVYVTQSIANTYYSVYINDVKKAEYLTPKGVDASSSVPDTTVIATELKNDLVTAGYTVEQTGSTLTITNFPANGKLSTQGGTGDKSVKCFINLVPSFSDLPPNSPEGRIVKVAGDLETAGDDYYVIYNKSGLWQETVAWDENEILDPATMPHALVRNTDGTWTFKQHEWGGRTVGDPESSKNSTFVGTTLNDIFVYQNRLGFLTDENIVLSEADNFENFYRTTVAQVLDSDPIDIAVLHNNVDILYHAVPYNRDLLLMSERNQFRLTFQNYLGQKTTQIQYSTSFNVSRRIKPVNIGSSVYFMDDRQDYNYAKFYEFFPKENSTLDDADEVSSQVPEYIPNDINFMAGSNRAKSFVIYSNNDLASLYFYKFFWSGERKVQSSWNKWTFQDITRIYWAGFSGAYLYLLMARPDGVSLERMRLDEDVFDTDYNYELLLDRRAVVAPSAMVYNQAKDYTTITLPYSTSVVPEVVCSDVPNSLVGLRLDVTRINATTVRVKGDVRSYTVNVGIPYLFRYTFSTMYFRMAQGQGESIVLDGRLQLRYLKIEYHNTAYFKAQLKTPGRDKVVSAFSASTVGTIETPIGKQAFKSGFHKMAVMSENTKAEIELVNDSPFPSSFGSAEWQGYISPKSVKRV